MKRLLLLLLVFFPSFAFGQDIIVLHNGERIEALVEKIDEKEICYKEWNFQQGPQYTLSNSKVVVILFRNGTSKVFETKQTLDKSQNQSGTESDEFISSIDPDATLSGDKRGNLFLNGVKLTDAQARQLLNRGDGRDYFDTWLGAHRQYRSGNTLLTLGFVFLGVSAICIAAETDNSDPYYSYDFSTAIMFAGSADLCICLGAIFRGVGRGRRNSVIDRYNNELRFSQNSSQLLLGPTSSGYGLTLTF